MPRRHHKIIRNVFSNWTGLAVGLVISFFLAPFVVHKLGNTFYGIWVLMMELTGYLGLLELGVRSSVIKYVAQYHASGETDELNELVSSAISLYAVMGVICLAVTFALAQLFPLFFRVDRESVDIARGLVVITGLTVAQGLVLNVFYGVLMGVQRYDVFIKVSIVFAPLRALLIVIFLSYGYGIITLGLIQLFVSLVSNMITYIYCKRLLPFLNINWFKGKKELYRRIMKYSLLSFALQISVKLMFYTDAWVIGFFLNASAITFYAIAGSLIEYLRKFVSQMTQVLNPLTSELESSGQFERIKEVLVNGTKFSLLIGCPVCAVYLLMGKQFISLWMGPEYADASYAVLLVLTVTHLFSLAQYTTGNILYGLNRHKIAVYCHGTEALANLALSIVLVKRLGILGVALGTAIPHLIVMVFILPIVITKIMKISLWEYVKQAYIPPLLSVTPFFAGCYIVNSWLPATSLSVYFLEVGALLPVYLITAWLFSFNTEQRLQYRSMLVPALLSSIKLR